MYKRTTHKLLLLFLPLFIRAMEIENPSSNELITLVANDNATITISKHAVLKAQGLKEILSEHSNESITKEIRFRFVNQKGLSYLHQLLQVDPNDSAERQKIVEQLVTREKLETMVQVNQQLESIPFPLHNAVSSSLMAQGIGYLIKEGLKQQVVLPNIDAKSNQSIFLPYALGFLVGHGNKIFVLDKNMKIASLKVIDINASRRFPVNGLDEFCITSMKLSQKVPHVVFCFGEPKNNCIIEYHLDKDIFKIHHFHNFDDSSKPVISEDETLVIASHPHYSRNACLYNFDGSIKNKEQLVFRNSSNKVVMSGDNKFIAGPRSYKPNCVVVYDISNDNINPATIGLTFNEDIHLVQFSKDNQYVIVGTRYELVVADTKGNHCQDLYTNERVLRDIVAKKDYIVMSYPQKIDVWYFDEEEHKLKQFFTLNNNGTFQHIVDFDVNKDKALFAFIWGMDSYHDDNDHFTLIVCDNLGKVCWVCCHIPVSGTNSVAFDFNESFLVLYNKWEKEEIKFFILDLQPLQELKSLSSLLQCRFLHSLDNLQKPKYLKIIAWLKILKLTNKYKSFGFAVDNILKFLKRPF